MEDPRVSADGSQSDEPESDHSPKRKRSGCLVGCLIFLPVFYFLSPLPILFVLVPMQQRGWDPADGSLESALNIYFTPINWLYERYEPVRTFYDWYLSWIYS